MRKPWLMFDIAREGGIIWGVKPLSKTPSDPALPGGVLPFLGHHAASPLRAAIADSTAPICSDRTNLLKPPSLIGFGSVLSATRLQTVVREQPRISANTSVH